MSVIAKLAELKILRCPEWLPSTVQYETIMGSVAYGANLEEKSDVDLYAVVIPPKDKIFPHLSGKIYGFDKFDIFESYQQTKITTEKESFDLTIYGIVRYFALCIENNPNMIDSLFTPIHCVRKLTQAGEILRDNRRLFLSKLCYSKFRGYAFSQLSKIKMLDNPNISLLDVYKSVKYSARLEKTNQTIDWKFAYHIVRLLLEAEQILRDNDLELARDGQFLKSIRQGYMTVDEILVWFGDKEKYLDKLCQESVLPSRPDREKIRKVLCDCLACVYENLDEVIYIPQTDLDTAIGEIRRILSNL